MTWKFQTRYDQLRWWDKIIFWIRYPDDANRWELESLEEELEALRKK